MTLQDVDTTKQKDQDQAEQQRPLAGRRREPADRRPKKAEEQVLRLAAITDHRAGAPGAR